ncbi:hypothetical protein EFA69_14705 [Rufibacter immobilis]|uniref:Uncharacterized protein n=1 Tax=Rufibacter immobilis TaxID=1348778 RepID=A0A3M9MQA0_9BACT|nr:hypothetical protein [Rufibacter immobilis]RNI27387.1 hypothetical protein EFA69_14705 [Rufibacter immobilis]
MSHQQEADLLEYFRQYKLLEEKGGPEQDGDLFEEVLAKEEEILQSFGLPPALKHLKLLHKLANRKSVTVAVLQKTIAALQKAAEAHLSGPVLTDLELLQKAKEEELSPYDILPELGIITHTYPIFLMEVALNFVHPQAILDEFYALKRLDCYGELYQLKSKHPKSFKRTKLYKQLKPYLKFIDQYVRYNPDEPVFIEDWVEEEVLDIAEGLTYKEDMAKPYDSGPASLFDEPAPAKAPAAWNPKYTVLTDSVVIEEIMFSRDSGVTVSGHLAQYYRPTRLMLGFEFDQLLEVIQVYRADGQDVLLYFNKNRQQVAGDEPVILNLKDKLGKELCLDQHYFKIYKSESLDREGNALPMEEEFYIVEEVLEKAKHDQQEVQQAKGELHGLFHHVRNHYYTYLNDLRSGMSDAQARKENGIDDYVKFELARLLYTIDKHGGKID